MTKKNKADRIEVPEINVTFQNDRNHDFPQIIKTSEIAANLIRSFFDKGEIELHEVMFIIFLNRSNEPIGYYKHSIGGTASTIVDTKIILGTALKSLSSALIISHNHPSGNIKPSESDKNLTKNLQESSKLLGITILDHLIITKDDYSSFADQGLMGADSVYPIHLQPTVQINENIQELEAQALAIELELLKF